MRIDKTCKRINIFLVTSKKYIELGAVLTRNPVYAGGVVPLYKLRIGLIWMKIEVSLLERVKVNRCFTCYHNDGVYCALIDYQTQKGRVANRCLEGKHWKKKGKK